MSVCSMGCGRGFAFFINTAGTGAAAAKREEKDVGGSFDDKEKERDFDLTEHDESEKRYTHHGMEIIDLEAQDEETMKDIIIHEKEAQVQVLMDNLDRAKYVITYL